MTVVKNYSVPTIDYNGGSRKTYSKSSSGKKIPPKAVAVDDYSDITLRPLELSDAEDFVEWYMDEKVAEFDCDDPFLDKESAIKYVTGELIRHPWQRAICLKGTPVGSITVSPFTGKYAHRAEIGFLVGSRHWGKGIATRAVKMAVKSVFLEWPHLERLEGLVHVDNKASQKVLLKARFTEEGVLRKYMILRGTSRDVVMFSILSTDPHL